MAWYIVTIILFEVFNLALILAGFALVAQIYSKQVTNLTNLMGDAFAERDAKFQKMRADLAHAFVTDTSVFDTSLEDLSDVEAPIVRGDTDGREDPDQTTSE